MTAPCSGLRVLDLSRGVAGAMATMVLADYGAEVIQVDLAGERPHADNPAHHLLDRGKRSISLDLTTPDGQAALQQLVRGVDILVESATAAEAARLGLDYAALSAINPALVQCSVTGWGRTGPLCELPAYDHLIMAKAGLMRTQAGWFQDGKRPVFRAGDDASFFAAMLTVQGILAAVRARDLIGRGQFIETNLLQALSVRQHPTVRWLRREGEELPDESAVATGKIQDARNALPHHMDPRQTNLIGMRVETKDGRWLVHSHTEPHFFPAWIKTIGFDWIWEDERFKKAPYTLSTEAKDELIELVRQRMKEKTADEWMELYLANGNVCGDVIQTTQQALRHPQVVAAGLLAEYDDPVVGAVTQVGPLVKFDGALPAVAPAAVPGADTDAVLAETATAPELPEPRATNLDGPLAGITIVECAYYYATPFATALLADLGARIIKIEPLRGDPYRLLAGGTTDDPVLNLGHNNMARAQQGKQSIALNLKDERGQEILRGLIERADVFVHSFRLGVPESLGIDEATLRTINPDIVYQYGASYGSIGPWARQPAIDPVVAAFVGTTAYQAGADNLPLTETGADPVAAAGHATAMMLGILAKERSGDGQSLESSMIVSNLYHNYRDAQSHAGVSLRPVVDHFQYGTGATYRLYECAPRGPEQPLPAPTSNPDPRWVFLAAVEDDEFARFCKVADRGDLAADPKFATKAARAEHRAELEGALEGVFLTRPAQDWEQRCFDEGVGCALADGTSHFAFVYTDPQAVEIGLMTASEHPSFGGTYYRHKPLVDLSATPGPVRSYCELGEYTRPLLRELGYDDQAMAELAEAEVVSWPGDLSVTAEGKMVDSTEKRGA